MDGKWIHQIDHCCGVDIEFIASSGQGCTRALLQAISFMALKK